MAYRTFRPTLRSFLPTTFKVTGQMFLTAVWWTGYAYRSSIPTFGLAMLVTLLQVYFIYQPAGYVAIQRINVGPYDVESLPVGRQRVRWRDITEVRISEKHRPWNDTRRTDRMIRICTSSPRCLGCNPSAWPQQDEDEFLDLLEQRSREYGFRISRQTSRI